MTHGHSIACGAVRIDLISDTPRNVEALLVFAPRRTTTSKIATQYRAGHCSPFAPGGGRMESRGQDLFKSPGRSEVPSAAMIWPHLRPGVRCYCCDRSASTCYVSEITAQIQGA